MQLLGKTRDDVAADLATIEQAARLRKTIDDGNGLSTAIAAHTDAVQKSADHIARTVEKLRADHRLLVLAGRSLGERRSDGDRARHSLRSLREQHPELLAEEEVPASID